jgi:apolipoprotein D and lipocalin family protein
VIRPLLVALAMVAAGCTDREPDVAKGVSLERFEGRWYEIARVPRDYDRTCHDTTADYRLVGPNRLEMTHRCHLASPTGTVSEFRAPATADDPAVPAKLTLDLGLYHGAYWVLAVGNDYEYALIGHPSLTMLWILSRTPALPAETFGELSALATRQGYGVGMLEMTPQSGAP